MNNTITAKMSDTEVNQVRDAKNLIESQSSIFSDRDLDPEIPKRPRRELEFTLELTRNIKSNQTDLRPRLLHNKSNSMSTRKPVVKRKLPENLLLLSYETPFSMKETNAD